MPDFFRRLIRYLNYPADTHGKVDEVLQRVRQLSDEFYEVIRRGRCLSPASQGRSLRAQSAREDTTSTRRAVGSASSALPESWQSPRQREHLRHYRSMPPPW